MSTQAFGSSLPNTSVAYSPEELGLGWEGQSAGILGKRATESRAWGPDTAGQARTPTPAPHRPLPQSPWLLGMWTSCQESSAISPVSAQQKARGFRCLPETTLLWCLS